VNLRIDKGDPRPWVVVGPNPGGQFFTVHCKRCEEYRLVYTVTLHGDPGLLARLASEHDNCESKPGSLNPWQPGTP
jgi:hypothetical protein